MNKIFVLYVMVFMTILGCKSIEKNIDINDEFDIGDIKKELGETLADKSRVSTPQDSKKFDFVITKPVPAKRPNNQSVREQLSEAVARFNVRKGEVYYDYYSEMIYVVITSVGKITDITLEPNEKVYSTPVIGDQIGWKIANGKSGSVKGEITHIYVRPDKSGIETNLIINTNKRVYRFILKATNGTFMANVQFSYPTQQITQEKTLQKLEANVKVNLSQINFGYSVTYTGRKRKLPFWVPDRVFDDGAKTFIYIPEITKISSLPVIFAELQKRQTEIVNYRIRGNYLIVDGIFSFLIMLEDVNTRGRIEIKRRQIR